MEREEERALVAGLVQGDRRAFQRVYREWSPRLFGFLLRLSQNRSVTDDLFQETWLRVARAAPKLPDDTRLGPWLYTIARNVFVSHHRWRMLDFDRLSSLALSFDPEWTPTPLELLDASRERERLERALGELPIPFREVLLLVDVQGLDAQDAATALGASHDATRQRLHRARKALRVILEMDASLRSTHPKGAT